MTESEAKDLATTLQRDQNGEAFRAAAANVATYYRELVKGGIRAKDALPLTAEMQSMYLCQMLGVEL